MTLLVCAVREELGDPGNGGLAGEPLGVGIVAATVGMMRLLASLRPDAVVMMGTGGSYPGGPALHTAVAAEQVGWSSGLEAMGMGYTPRPPPPIACDPRLLERLGLPRVGVLTAGAISTDPLLAGRLADGWQVEHLEGYGVAAACAAAGVPFALVVGITHQAGPDAHAQWLVGRAAARAAVRAAIHTVLV